MQVRLKNDWFDQNGKIWPKGLIEYHGEEEDLPSSAKIVDDDNRGPRRKETPAAIEGELPISAIATHNAEIAEGKVTKEELPTTVPDSQLNLNLLGGGKPDEKKADAKPADKK